MKLIIVTACPQGVATSFLAARALERAAQQKGWEARTDIRSPQQPLSSLPEDVIASADLVVAATGTPTDLNAYAGKRH